MAEVTPQYFRNDVTLIEVSKSELQDALDSLLTVTLQGIQMTNSSPVSVEDEPGGRGTIFTGDIGRQ